MSTRQNHAQVRIVRKNNKNVHSTIVIKIKESKEYCRMGQFRCRIARSNWESRMDLLWLHTDHKRNKILVKSIKGHHSIFLANLKLKEPNQEKCLTYRMKLWTRINLNFNNRISTRKPGQPLQHPIRGDNSRNKR